MENTINSIPIDDSQKIDEGNLSDFAKKRMNFILAFNERAKKLKLITSVPLLTLLDIELPDSNTSNND